MSDARYRPVRSRCSCAGAGTCGAEKESSSLVLPLVQEGGLKVLGVHTWLSSSRSVTVAAPASLSGSGQRKERSFEERSSVRLAENAAICACNLRFGCAIGVIPVLVSGLLNRIKYQVQQNLHAQFDEKDENRFARDHHIIKSNLLPNESRFTRKGLCVSCWFSSSIQLEFSEYWADSGGGRRSSLCSEQRNGPKPGAA